MAGKHEHGKMDIEVQKRTFDGFIRFWVWVFGAAILILLFLAVFNS
jgi:Ni,Fe-hydrogenase I cytochrome b subunit